MFVILQRKTNDKNMKKLFMIFVAMAITVVTIFAQGHNNVVSLKTEGLKGPVRLVNHRQVDSSTSGWKGCTVVHPTLIFAEIWIFAKDGLLKEYIYSEKNCCWSSVHTYDKRRRLKHIESNNYEVRFSYKGKRVKEYKWITYNEIYKNDTTQYKFKYQGNVVSIDRIEKRGYRMSSVETYENGLLMMWDRYDDRILYIRNEQGQLLKELIYWVDCGYDDNDEWYRKPTDSLMYCDEYIYTDRGDLAEKREMYIKSRELYITSYTYLEYDAYGNWTRRRVKYTNNLGEEAKLRDEIRQIYYYE